MSVKKNLIIALAAVVAMGASLAIAQTTKTIEGAPSTTYEIRQGTVLNVYGNHLVVQMADGTVRDADVPADFLFEVDGKKVPISQLTPGTKLTQTIATVSTPNIVQTTEIREAVVVQRIGQTLIYRDRLGRLNKITGIPEGFTIFRDGRPVPITALAGGDRVTAHIVRTEESIITEEEMNVAGAAPVAPTPKPAPVAKPAPAPEPEPAPAPAPVLPKTGSSLPLVGLLGLLALAAGLGVGVIRRF